MLFTLLSLLLIISPFLFAADPTLNQSLVDLDNKISIEVPNIMTILDQVMIVIIIGGVIYVSGTLLTEKRVSSKAVTAWVVAIVIWGVAKIIFGISET